MSIFPTPSPSAPSSSPSSHLRWVVPVAIFCCLLVLSAATGFLAGGGLKLLGIGVGSPRPNANSSVGPTPTPTALNPPRRPMSAAAWREHGPCGLLTATDIESSGVAKDDFGATGRLFPVSRTAGARDPVAGRTPTETCEFGTVEERRGPLRITVAERPFETYFAYGDEQPETVERLGTDAEIAGKDGRLQVVVHRGDEQVVVELSSYRKSPQGLRETLVALVRKAYARLPEKLPIGALSADGTCAKLDAKALRAAMRTTPTYSRSLTSEGRTSCSFTADKGAQATVLLNTRPNGDRMRSRLRNLRNPLEVEGLRASFEYDTLEIYGDATTLSITARPPYSAKRDKSGGTLTGLGRSAVRAFDVRRPAPERIDGWNVCALLSSNEASALAPREDKNRLVVEGRRVTVSEEGVPTDLCSYGAYLHTSAMFSEVEVGLSAKVHNPVRERDRAGEPVPVKGLGSKAYLVEGFSGTTLVVERRGSRTGWAQLTITARPRSEMSQDARRKALVKAARTAYGRVRAAEPGRAVDAQEPCRAIDPARLMTGKTFAYLRGVAFHPDALCILSTSSGETLSLSVTENPTEYERQRAGRNRSVVEVRGVRGVRAYSDERELIVVGRRSLVTVRMTTPSSLSSASPPQDRASIARELGRALLR